MFPLIMIGMTHSADIRNPYDRRVLENRRFLTLSNVEKHNGFMIIFTCV